MGRVKTEYDRIGLTYAATRRSDPRLLEAIERALGEAVTIANVGAGTGSYESPDRRVTAFEPSQTMIAQRPPDAAPAITAFAEDLPAHDDSFDGAMAILTIHHWRDQGRGLREMRRVATGPDPGRLPGPLPRCGLVTPRARARPGVPRRNFGVCAARRRRRTAGG